MTDKVAYVRKRLGNNPGDHHCHWPGCKRHVPAAVWGCKPHWYALPQKLRNRIWATFRPGQEETKTPSREYVTVAREVQDWIRLEQQEYDL